MVKFKLHHFKSLTSTQDKAKQFAKKGMRDLIVVSGIQTKGRGRFKREWHSSKGGLWFSILLKPKNTENLQLLTFAAAVSVVQSIEEIAKLNTKIKWPNDVHFRGRKLCGILTEGIFGEEDYVIVGIGLNVNQKSFPKYIKKIAASLKSIKNREFDKSRLLESIVNNFSVLYKNYFEKNKQVKIIKLWKKYCDTLNRNIKIVTVKGDIHGKAIGINKDCSLVVKLNSGKKISVIEGDVSVRH